MTDVSVTGCAPVMAIISAIVRRGWPPARAGWNVTTSPGPTVMVAEGPSAAAASAGRRAAPVSDGVTDTSLAADDSFMVTAIVRVARNLGSALRGPNAGSPRLGPNRTHRTWPPPRDVRRWRATQSVVDGRAGRGGSLGAPMTATKSTSSSNVTTGPLSPSRSRPPGGSPLRSSDRCAKLRGALGEAFIAGVVLYTGTSSYRLEDRLYAMPFDRLWSGH